MTELQHTPTEVEAQFISAFTNLKESLLSELLENNEPEDTQMWTTYHEIEALINRLYAGEEEIISPKDELENVS